MSRITLLLILSGFITITNAVQPAVDTMLFTIKLTDDTTSLYGCRWDDKVRSTLAGPVLMGGKHLLFYSQDGYVLYNESGKLLDSHSLLRQNRSSEKKGEEPLRLAYPLDSITLVYYRKKKDLSIPTEIFLKKIFKKQLKKVTTGSYQIYEHISRGQLFNLAANSITDEMGQRNFLMPLLVGYTKLDGGTRWWSVDRLYFFTSPLIVEEEGKCSSFFPGLKADQKCEIQPHKIEPLGVYQFQDRWYYFGISSSLGNTEDEYYQMLVLCDQAGNLLYSSKLLKQQIGDALLQYVKKTNTNYTVRRAVQHVFVPAINRDGDICYGIIDFENKEINVFKRMFLRYYPNPSKKLAPSVFECDNELAFTPMMLDCTEDSQKGLIPEITKLSDDGIKPLSKEQLVMNGYYVTVHRVTDEKIKTKLSRTQSGLPKNVQKAQDSIAGLISAWCPFSLALNHEERGRLSFLHYGFHDEVLSARVLRVTEKNDVFVRVDCEKWAEVVQFDGDGSFVNRFIFNTQDYQKRKDLVAVGKNGNVAEEDYEGPKNIQGFYIWKLQSADKFHTLE